eukprot:GGOE01003466.1.p2 GENE.GGOE01003466.1~~GGOE01003466.1.p2  ORF type:complete len:184 (+),score=13.64 GGOE01003466.1:375-926(+)
MHLNSLLQALADCTGCTSHGLQNCDSHIVDISSHQAGSLVVEVLAWLQQSWVELTQWETEAPQQVAWLPGNGCTLYGWHSYDSDKSDRASHQGVSLAAKEAGLLQGTELQPAANTVLHWQEVFYTGCTPSVRHNLGCNKLDLDNTNLQDLDARCNCLELGATLGHPDVDCGIGYKQPLTHSCG